MEILGISPVVIDIFSWCHHSRDKRRVLVEAYCFHGKSRARLVPCSVNLTFRLRQGQDSDCSCHCAVKASNRSLLPRGGVRRRGQEETVRARAASENNTRRRLLRPSSRRIRTYSADGGEQSVLSPLVQLCASSLRALGLKTGQYLSTNYVPPRSTMANLHLNSVSPLCRVLKSFTGHPPCTQ